MFRQQQNPRPSERFRFDPRDNVIETPPRLPRSRGTQNKFDFFYHLLFSSAANELGAAAFRGFGDFEAYGDALTQFFDMGDDADEAVAALLEIDERFDRRVKGLAVERTEPFVDENRVKPDTARVLLDDIGEAECERE